MTAPGRPGPRRRRPSLAGGRRPRTARSTAPRSGRIVFADPAALRELEALVHPAVRPRILARIAAAEAVDAPAIAIEAIKLVEGGLAAECDEVWLVTCDPDAQRRAADRRAARRATDADQRVAAQAGLAARLAPYATLILDTSGTEAETEAIVDEALGEALAAPPSGPMNAARPGEPGRAVGGASGQRRATEGAARSGVLPGSAVAGPPP